MQSIAEKETKLKGSKFVVLDDVNREHNLGKYVIISCVEWGDECVIEHYHINLNSPQEAIKIMNLLVSTWDSGYTRKTIN